MAAVSAIRDGLQARLQTIAGLRASDTVPALLPVGVSGAAVVGPPTLIEYDSVMARGCDRYEFPIRVYVGRTDETSAQDTLDAYLAGTGASSLKTAIEGEGPGLSGCLGGAAQTCRVTRADNYGVYALGGVQYLGVELTVEVYA